MRYYFAAAYQRKPQINAWAWEIERVGIGAEVTSRWLTGGDLTLTDAGLSAGNLLTTAAVEAAWEFGQVDLEDLSNSEAIVSFTGEGTRGGRHIEHGVAISYHDNHPRDLSKRTEPMRLIVVGPREHVFHCHPATEHFDTWSGFLVHEINQHHRKARAQ